MPNAVTMPLLCAFGGLLLAGTWARQYGVMAGIGWGLGGTLGGFVVGLAYVLVSDFLHTRIRPRWPCFNLLVTIVEYLFLIGCLFAFAGFMGVLLQNTKER